MAGKNETPVLLTRKKSAVYVFLLLIPEEAPDKGEGRPVDGKKFCNTQKESVDRGRGT